MDLQPDDAAPWPKKVEFQAKRLPAAPERFPIIPLPSFSFSQWAPSLVRIHGLSLSWRDRDDGSSQEDLTMSIARRTAVELRKMGQASDPPRIYPYLGSENLFFGNIEGHVGQVFDDLYFEFNCNVGQGKVDCKVLNFRTWLKNDFEGHRKDLKVLDVSKSMRDYPAVNLVIHGIEMVENEGRPVSCIAFLACCWDDGTFSFIISDYTWTLLVDGTKSRQRTKTVQKALFRHAGINSQHLEMLDRRDSGADADYTQSYAYISGTCHTCNFWNRSGDQAGIEAGCLEGALWCIHSRYAKLLREHLKDVFKMCGNPHRLSISGSSKGYLPEKRKLYFALVELGDALGPGRTDVASLSALNTAAPAPQTLLLETVLATDKTFLKPLTFSTSPENFMLKGRAPVQAFALKADFSFATQQCMHGTDDDCLQEERSLNNSKPTYFVSPIIPDGCRLVKNMFEMEIAIDAGLIPIAICNSKESFGIRAAAYTCGYTCYYMRECVHCAVVRVEKLMKTAGPVLILAGNARKYQYFHYPVGRKSGKRW